MPNSSTYVPMNPYEFVAAYGNALAGLLGGGATGSLGIQGQVNQPTIPPITPPQSPVFISGIFASSPPYNAKFDGRVAQDGACTAGSATITSTNINITNADIGKLAVLTGASTNGALQFTSGKILAVTPGVSILIDRNMATSGSISNGYLAIATDDTAAIQRALNDASANGQGSSTYVGVMTTRFANRVVVPAGLAIVTTTIIVPDGVTLSGQGLAFGDETSTPNSQPGLSGTVIMAGSATGIPFSDTGGLVKVGVSTGSAGKSGASNLSPANSQIEYVTFDGAGQVGTAVYLHGYQATMHHCWAHRGGASTSVNSCQVLGDNTNAMIHDNIMSGYDAGHGAILTGSDSQICDNIIYRYGGSSVTYGGIFVQNSGDHLISRNHLYQQNPLQSGVSSSGMVIRNVGASGVLRGILIHDNTIDGNWGHQIRLDCIGPNATMADISIRGNYSQQVTNFPDNTYDFVQISSAATSYVWNISINGNTGFIGPVSTNLRNIVSVVGQGASSAVGITLVDNHFDRCNNIVPTGYVLPGTNLGNSANTYLGGTPGIIYSNDKGSSTFTGNGTTTVFTVPHKLGDVPQYINVNLNALVTSNSFATPSGGQTISTFTVAFQNPLPTTSIAYSWVAGL